MDFGSENQPPENSKGASGELSDLLGIISANSSLAEDLHQSPHAREQYLANLRAAIERAQELAEEMSSPPASTTPPRGGASSQSPNKSILPDGARSTILHVDDDATTRELVAQLLSDAGYIVHSAPSGFDGVEFFRRNPLGVNLVIVDLVMPLMDGEETFSRLREIRPDVPVMLVTGFIQEDRLERLKSVGLAGFVRKPIPPDELVSTVRATLEAVKYSGGFVGGGSGGSIAL